METTSLARQVRNSKYLVGLAMLATIGVYCYKFGLFGLVESREAWGQFGDFFGGMLNPIISAAAFYWLATSVLLQKAELSETREALKATQNAQQQHADTALVTAKFQRENIRLTMVGGKLAALLSRQTHLLQIQADRGPDTNYFDRNSKGTQISVALKQLNSQIEELELEEAECFGKIAQQGLELREETAVSYHNHSG